MTRKAKGKQVIPSVIKQNMFGKPKFVFDFVKLCANKFYIAFRFDADDFFVFILSPLSFRV